MYNPIPVVLADMRKTAVGVVAVVLLVAVAVALGVAVSAQERALRKGSAQAADRFDLIVGAPGSETQLVLTTVYLQPAALKLIDGALVRQLQADPGVELVAPVAFGDYHGRFPVVGTTAAFAVLGGAPAEGRIFGRMSEAVVGADVPLPVGHRFHPRHGQAGAIDLDEDDHDHEEGEEHHDDDDHDEHVHQELEYEVVGRLPRLGTPWDRAIVVPVESVWWVHGLPTGHADAGHADTDHAAAGEPGHPEPAHHHADPGSLPIGDRFEGPAVPGVPALVVKPKSVNDAYRLRGALRTDHTMALFPAEVLIDLYATLGDARALLAAIAVGTQVLVVGAVLLAVFASLSSRRRQLAVLRALGASRGYVFGAVWLHVTAMVAAGGVLGLGLGWAGAWALSTVFAAETGLMLPVALTGAEVAMVAVLVLAGGILALVPAAAVYRQPVTATLRS